MIKNNFLGVLFLNNVIVTCFDLLTKKEIMTIEEKKKELIFVECLLSGPLLACGFGRN